MGKGKDYVISDIHGCLKTFSKLLDLIALSKEDNLYLLGDYVDRGPDSKGVLDLIIELKQSNYSIFPIKGNHEEELQFHLGSKILRKNLEKLYTENNVYEKKYFHFLHELPYYIELEKYILVHAGFDFTSGNIFENKEAMLWTRDWEDNYNPFAVKGKTIIHGHTPTKLKKIIRNVEKNSPILPLDNGCVYQPYSSRLGHLVCFELNKQELKWVKNIDVV